MTTLLLVAALAAGQSARAKPAGEWTQWRGPNRDGVSTETGLLQTWPAEGPALVWESKGAGRGYASVVLGGGRIYTMGDAPSGAPDKDEYLLAFNAKDGKPLWRAKLGPPWTDGDASWQSSRATPTLDDKTIYALTAHGRLVCADAATGKEKWSKDLKKDFGGRKGDGWGYSESPLVDGEKLVVTPGGSKATMVCLNKKTGAPAWAASVPNDPGAGHASIVPVDVGKVRVYVTTTAGGAVGVRAKDGKVLWTYPIEETTAVIPTPIVAGELVFFTAGYNRGGALLRQVPTSDGGVKVEEVYGLKTELNNKHGGVVLVGDHLYGDANDGGTPWCAELLTGKVAWRGRPSAGRGSMSVAAADGCLYLRFASGQMALAKADPAGFAEAGSFKVPHSGERPSWSHPVVAGGKLYLREGDWLLCYDVKAK